MDKETVRLEGQWCFLLRNDGDRWEENWRICRLKGGHSGINRLTVQSIHWPLSAVSFTWCTLVGLDPQLNFDLVC